MKIKLNIFLTKANLASLNSTQFLIITGVSIALLWLLVFGITGSHSIAVSICVCLFSQVLESLRARVALHTQRSNIEWPKYLDAIYSSVWSGSSLQEAIVEASKYAPTAVRPALVEFELDDASGLGFDQCLANLKVRLSNPIADRFVELTRMASISGGRGFLPALRAQSAQLRAENAVWAEIQAKQNWVLSTAKLAIIAPWLVLLLLGFRRETAQAFESETGLAVLGLGLIASLLAFKLIRVLGKLPTRLRVLI